MDNAAAAGLAHKAWLAAVKRDDITEAQKRWTELDKLLGPGRSMDWSYAESATFYNWRFRPDRVGGGLLGNMFRRG
jgi:hypothetical protein